MVLTRFNFHVIFTAIYDQISFHLRPRSLSVILLLAENAGLAQIDGYRERLRPREAGETLLGTGAKFQGPNGRHCMLSSIALGSGENPLSLYCCTR